HDEKRSAKILQMIIALSKQLGMPVITEGVETIEQVNFLKEIGCDMFQGYYFAKPMSVEQFENTYLS
ncbi:MAG: EAL domain-containing protein, partial [Coprococcus sp.]